MTMLLRHAIALAAAPMVMGMSVAIGAEIGPPTYAIPARADDTVTMTVDGTDYPVCAEEDCSDQPGQIGVWYSGHLGRWLLELGEGQTYVVQP